MADCAMEKKNNRSIGDWHPEIWLQAAVCVLVICYAIHTLFPGIQPFPDYLSGVVYDFVLPGAVFLFNFIFILLYLTGKTRLTFVKLALLVGFLIFFIAMFLLFRYNAKQSENMRMQMIIQNLPSGG